MPNRAQSSYLVCFATAERAFEFRAGERRLRVLLLRDDCDSTDGSSESGDDSDMVPPIPPVTTLSGVHLDEAEALAQRVRRHLIAAREHGDAACALLREAMQLPPAALQHVLAVVDLQPGELRVAAPHCGVSSSSVASLEGLCGKRASSPSSQNDSTKRAASLAAQFRSVSAGPAGCDPMDVDEEAANEACAVLELQASVMETET